MQMISLILGYPGDSWHAGWAHPCLGALNWLNIPFAGIGLIVRCACVWQTSARSTTGADPAGITCCAIALFVGIIRLNRGPGRANSTSDLAAESEIRASCGKCIRDGLLRRHTLAFIP